MKNQIDNIDIQFQESHATNEINNNNSTIYEADLSKEKDTQIGFTDEEVQALDLLIASFPSHIKDSFSFDENDFPFLQPGIIANNSNNNNNQIFSNYEQRRQPLLTGGNSSDQNGMEMNITNNSTLNYEDDSLYVSTEIYYRKDGLPLRSKDGKIVKIGDSRITKEKCSCLFKEDNQTIIALTYDALKRRRERAPMLTLDGTLLEDSNGKKIKRSDKRIKKTKTSGIFKFKDPDHGISVKVKSSLELATTNNIIPANAVTLKKKKSKKNKNVKQVENSINNAIVNIIEVNNDPNNNNSDNFIADFNHNNSTIYETGILAFNDAYQQQPSIIDDEINNNNQVFLNNEQIDLSFIAHNNNFQDDINMSIANTDPTLMRDDDSLYGYNEIYYDEKGAPLRAKDGKIVKIDDKRVRKVNKCSYFTEPGNEPIVALNYDALKRRKARAPMLNLDGTPFKDSDGKTVMRSDKRIKPTERNGIFKFKDTDHGIRLEVKSPFELTKTKIVPSNAVSSKQKKSIVKNYRYNEIYYGEDGKPLRAKDGTIVKIGDVRILKGSKNTNHSNIFKEESNDDKIAITYAGLAARRARACMLKLDGTPLNDSDGKIVKQSDKRIKPSGTIGIFRFIDPVCGIDVEVKSSFGLATSNLNNNDNLNNNSHNPIIDSNNNNFELSNNNNASIFEADHLSLNDVHPNPITESQSPDELMCHTLFLPDDHSVLNDENNFQFIQSDYINYEIKNDNNQILSNNDVQSEPLTNSNLQISFDSEQISLYRSRNPMTMYQSIKRSRDGQEMNLALQSEHKQRKL